MAEKFLINVLEDENTHLDMTTLILQNENYKSKLKQYLNRMHNTEPVYHTEELCNQNDELCNQTEQLCNQTEDSSDNNLNTIIIYETKISMKKKPQLIIGTFKDKDKKNSQIQAAKNALNYFNIN